MVNSEIISLDGGADSFVKHLATALLFGLQQ